MPAAGLSSRFGSDDKLLAKLAGKAVAQHAIDAVAGMAVAERIAVLPAGTSARRDLFRRSGYQIVDNPNPREGMGRSLALGARAVKTSAVLIVLADMPLIPSAHMRALIDKAGEDDCVMTRSSGEGAAHHPPALASGRYLTQLRLAQGDKGLRGLTREAVRSMVLPSELLDDVDTPQALSVVSQNWLTRAALRDRYTV